MTTRLSTRAMLALVALADLPTPTGVSFVSDHILSLALDTIADGQAWSRYLGGSTDTCVSNRTTYLNEGRIDWHGWSVQLHAYGPGPVAPTALDAVTTARLALTAGGAVAA